MEELCLIANSLAHAWALSLYSFGPPALGWWCPGWAGPSLPHQSLIQTAPHRNDHRPIWCGQILRWDSLFPRTLICVKLTTKMLNSPERHWVSLSVLKSRIQPSLKQDQWLSFRLEKASNLCKFFHCLVFILIFFLSFYVIVVRDMLGLEFAHKYPIIEMLSLIQWCRDLGL